VKYLLSTLFVVAGVIGIYAQGGTDRDLAGLKGKVKTIEYLEQELERDRKTARKVETITVDEYDEAGSLARSSYFQSGERRIWFTLDGSRVARSERFESPAILLTVEPYVNPEPNARKKPADPRYAYEYTYTYDKSGRIAQIDQYSNDGTLFSARKFTYDAKNRLASDTTMKNGRVDDVDTFKYDTAGNEAEKTAVSYYPTGARETILYRYSKYKFDTSGNWIQRTATIRDAKGEWEQITIETRKITYH
jgi:hypothetical protein